MTRSCLKSSVAALITAAFIHGQVAIYVPPRATSLGGDYVTGYTYSVRPNTAASRSPLWGIADLHTHPMAHLAFGKKAFFGEPDGAMPWALRDCSEFHGPGGVGWGGTAGSLFIAFFEGGFGHYTNGYPNFDGWPRYTSRLHQQMYVDWLHRAYQGGLRLLVSHAVQNGLLAKEFAGVGYDDATSIEEQIQAMKDFAFRHADWLEIAYTPADARRIIGQNKLAMVLGVEVDSLGTPSVDYGWAETPSLSVYLPHLYGLGVRHIFPVHLADNNLGGAAVYGTMFNILNWHLRGGYFAVKQASSDIHYRLNEQSSEEKTLAFYYSASGFYPPDYSVVPGGHENRRGLTNAGYSALRHMMSLGMIVDTDHMSNATFESALAVAEALHCPVVGGHMAMRELGFSSTETRDPHKWATEYGRSGLQLQRMANLGGMIGVGLNQTRLRTFTESNGLTNDGPNTSKSFAQAYLYALQKANGAGVAIGTDFNGLPGSLGPRFGPAALPGEDDVVSQQNDMARQTSGVRYTTALEYVNTARWNPGDSMTGEQRDVFQAIALARSTHLIDSFNLTQIPPKVRSLGSQIWIRNVSKGMRAARLSDLPSPSFWDQTFNYNSARVQRAAWYAKTHSDESGIADTEIRRIYNQIRPVYLMYAAMDGPNAPLTRSIAGNRDFDINLDGVAHIGMIPDLLQDLRNAGLTPAQLAPLFRSAEDYIAMWETVETRKSR
jgi:microsomal dipeptidase-like Zn-dependent dipeptidase